MYLKGTMYMKLYPVSDSLSNILWRSDGSFGVNWDSKGHNGAMKLIGKGDIVDTSRKQKMNVASSTELELVNIADVLGMILWCNYFMEPQGYTIKNNIFDHVALGFHEVITPQNHTKNICYVYQFQLS